MEQKKHGVWMVTVRDRPPAIRRGDGVDPDIRDAIRRADCRKPPKKRIIHIK